MNYFKTSTGERVSKAEIDKKVRKAKEQKIIQNLVRYGYITCQTCLRNDCKPVDCAHIVSVDTCQKNGYCEKAWDLDNIILEGRECHKKRDKLNIISSKLN
jgi:hypothetical protein